MSEYGFSVIHILSYKDRIVDSALIQENTEQRKNAYFHFLYSITLKNQVK